MTTTYIDVRTPEEFAEGHHPEAINHPVELIESGTMPNVPVDAHICVYCRSGGRAGRAKSMMESAGFTDVTNGGGLSDVLTSSH